LLAARSICVAEACAPDAEGVDDRGGVTRPCQQVFGLAVLELETPGRNAFASVSTRSGSMLRQEVTLSSSIFGHMEASLAGYLADITHGAQSGDERTAAHVARFEQPRVIAALRAVLYEHRPDEYGRCPACRTRRFGRAPAPCRAYLTAHLCLLVTEEDPNPIDANTTDIVGMVGPPG
jgi:hypothetical protein